MNDRLSLFDFPRFDFDAHKHSIVLLNGANASGKSAFLEVVLLALFGESIPSRTTPTAGTMKEVADTLINQSRADKAPATTDLVFSVNGAMHRITRTFLGSQDRTVASHKTAVLFDLKANQAIAHGPNLIKPWIDTHIGSIESYLLTAMHTQHDDRNFFSLSSAEQMEILDRLFHMRPCQLFQVCVCVRLCVCVCDANHYISLIGKLLCSSAIFVSFSLFCLFSLCACR